jgi:teichoic acid transport system ATP-binding protein
MEVKEQAGTVFLVSHSSQTVLAMCERAIWLDQGQIVQDGPSETVVEAYRRAKPPSSRGMRRR